MVRESRHDVFDSEAKNMNNRQAGADEILRGLEHRTTYRFSMIAARHTRAFSTLYSERFGLNMNTWKVLSVVGHFGPLSANKTGTHSSLEPDKVTRAVDALVEQGFVLRRQDSVDRRRVVLSLSVKGRRVHDELSRIRDAIEYEFLRVLAPAEIAALYSIVDKLEARAIELFSDKKAWRAIVDRLTTKPKPPRKQARGRRAADSSPLRQTA
jgi:DNA-binding MarR family transcriptional regulator